MAYTTGHEFAREIADALGLKHCRSLELRIAVDEAVTVKAEIFVEADRLAEVVKVIRKYDVQMRTDVGDVSRFGDEVKRYNAHLIDAIGANGCKASVSQSRLERDDL